MHLLTGGGNRVFPGALARRTHEREHNQCGASTHGLRAIEDDRPRVYRGEASTLLHEAGFPTQIIERQLVHVEPDEVKAAYNPAERLPHATQDDAGGGQTISMPCDREEQGTVERPAGTRLDASAVKQ